MFYYALTLRKTRKPILLSDYTRELDYLKDLGYDVKDVNYEDTKGLHVHCVVRSDSVIVYDDKKFKRRGWNYYFKPIFYHKGWIKYATKDISKDIFLRYQQEELELFAPPDWHLSLETEPSEASGDALPHVLERAESPTCYPDKQENDDSASMDSSYKRFLKRIKKCRIV